MFNKTNAAEAVKNIKKGKAVLFMGAGVAVEAGLPSWKSALEKLADYIEAYDPLLAQIMRQRLSRKNFLSAADFYYKAETTPDIIIKGLEKTFGKSPQINSNLRTLMRLTINNFITTNYDQTIENAWASEKATGLNPFCNSNEDFTFALRHLNQQKEFVLHLHGMITKPTSLLLCGSDYQRIREMDEYFQFLRELIINYSIIFIGFSFYDPAIKAFIEYTRDKLAFICEKPSFALIPGDYNDLKDFLLKANIIPIEYDHRGDHSNLWKLVEWMKDQIRTAPQAEIPQQTEDEIRKLKHNLASVYTHFKIRRNHEDIYESIFAGITHYNGTKIRTSGQLITEGLLVKALIDFLHIAESEGFSIVRRSLSVLSRQGFASRTNEHYDFKEIDLTIDKDLRKLVESIRNRAKLRYLKELSYSDSLIQEFLLAILLEDGVRLAHSILTKQPAPLFSIGNIYEKSFEKIFKGTPHHTNLHMKDVLLRSIQSLLESPNKEEATILGSISRIAFLTDLTIHEPNLKSFNMKGRPYNLYLDASILLPSISEYHPRSKYYSLIIARAQKKNIKIVVSDGFLEEILSHRKSAIDIFNQNFKGNPKRLEDFVLFYGSDNINVFLGAFSNWYATNKEYDFLKFMRQFAPYSNSSELISFLERRGIHSEHLRSGLSLDMGIIARWKAALKDWYDKRGGGKEEVLITHEAIQLEALSVNNAVGKNSMFLTADKRFIASAMEVSQIRHLDYKVITGIVMPVQFSYYLDIDEEGDIDWRAYSKILWSRGYKELHKNYDEFYINRILNEYEPKLIDSIPRIMASIQKEIDHRPTISETDLQSDDVKMRQYIYLEQFDEKFYSIMNEERKKHGIS